MLAFAAVMFRRVVLSSASSDFVSHSSFSCDWQLGDARGEKNYWKSLDTLKALLDFAAQLCEFVNFMGVEVAVLFTVCPRCRAKSDSF